MTSLPRGGGVRVLLLDIEGTTTPLTFVSDILFPYARKHLRAFLQAHEKVPEVASAIEALNGERSLAARADPNQPEVTADIASYAEWLMERDVKSPGLKALQGLIWKGGYESGELHGDVFADVPEVFRAAKPAGIRIAIYSSGSVLAQRLIFGSTQFGDLTPEIAAYFDTAVGPKREARSYSRIARELDCDPASILFLSDVIEELEAARAAGCPVALVVRPGNPPQRPADVPVVRDIAEALDLAIAPSHGRPDY